MPDFGSDDDDSVRSDETDDSGETKDDDRNEIDEVHKASSQDTFRVQVGRLAVTTALLITAIAVTVTTYIFLQREQHHNFEEAFEQFSRTVRDAAVAQQTDILDAYTGLSNQITSNAQSSNATWPFFTLPLFESYAEDALRQSRTEAVLVANFVPHEKRATYEEYANENYETMVKEGHLLQKGNLDRLTETGYHPNITRPVGGGVFEPDEERDHYFSVWSFSPPPFAYGIINWNMIAVPDYDAVVKAMLELKNETLVTPVRRYVAAGVAFTQEEHEALHSDLAESQTEHPHSFIFRPIHERIHDYNSPIVGLISSGFAWDASLQRLVPEGVNGLIAVIRNNCNQSYTYEINGPDAIYQGEGDLHESKFDDYERVVDLAIHTHPNFTTTPGHCQFSMSVYPSSRFEDNYDSNIPEIFALVVSLTFAVVAVVFYVYDKFVQRRNEKLVERAARSGAIVTSLFPTTIRDRLLEEKGTQKKRKGQGSGNLKSFLATGAIEETTQFDSKPLADLFLETTIMFADIVGFTAWSSVREPSQVFTLLETVYSAFDEIARKRRVFKVETVGDCYVAVCGLPDPRKDHHVAMCRFAADILTEMHSLVKKLEVSLGPDTCDLSLRIGVHSGPVTAGVLRGERSRFQLFGDTMNTTARIESTSENGRIQLSQETADLLTHSGKGHWVRPREKKVAAKGKGEMQTYWLELGDKNQDDDATMMATGRPVAEASSDDEEVRPLPTPTNLTRPNRVHVEASGVKVESRERTNRLIDWNVELLLRLLKQIVARRGASKGGRSVGPAHHLDEHSLEKGNTVLEEVKEIITLPEFDSEAVKMQLSEAEISPFVIDQLQDYVTCIAAMYRSNPFHNFDHASHVVMSVGKLMSRIVAPDIQIEEPREKDKSGGHHSVQKAALTLHDHTYGITSDPLTQFACAFSALIHDVDHTGVPNAQLIKENASIASLYKNRSVAEQNSFDISWELLMDKRYKDLRATIYTTEEELRRFRQLVVNGVMATDIVDKELKELRNARWEKAFKKDEEQALLIVKSKARENTNRRATIVIEHLIQASDVAHTMQHWHIYRKWNECLFREMYLAYKEGRADKNPAEFWYKGEIGFFDFYIIPLAKKLKDCGVFGVSSDEYLNYALRNRDEWENRGDEIVSEMVEKLSPGRVDIH